MYAKTFHVYILAKARNSTFYVGMTSNLKQRIYEHKHDIKCSFTSKYGIKTLVYFEAHQDAEAAIMREKQLKKWNRSWKMKLIEDVNPDWNDLYETFF